MDELSFSKGSGQMHHCTSHRDGDWITWRCPQCTGYERRFNWRTGEMHIQRGDTDILHVGISTRESNMEALARISNLN